MVEIVKEYFSFSSLIVKTENRCQFFFLFEPFGRGRSSTVSTTIVVASIASNGRSELGFNPCLLSVSAVLPKC